MPTIYMLGLIFKFRVHIFRLCIHRRHTRLESICSLAHLIAPRLTPTLAKKKALLIGICGSGDSSGKKKDRRLKGPHNDVKAMSDLLIDLYGYTHGEITKLLDDGKQEDTQPTQERILQAIKDLVKGAERGDRFLFYFAGHASQIDTKNPEEEDGKDEHIVSCDGKLIKDDTLNEYLVKPLPSGCTLRAVIDACHSGSLLDLEHYACNRVYVPWTSKGGKRGVRTLWYRIAKQNAIIMPPLETSRRSTHRSSNDPFLPSITNTLASPVGVQPSVVESSKIYPPKTRCLTVVTETPHLINTQVRFCQSPIDQISSPEARFCDAIHCFNEDDIPEFLSSRADVLCLSSSRDEQKTWEDGKGGSMTQKLVKILRANPNPTLHRMMTHVSHEIHNFYVELHPDARQHKKECAIRKQQKAAQKAARQVGGTASPFLQQSGPAKARKLKSLSLEFVNFQDPELSSHFPITPKNMRIRTWDM
ncbi:hypothetical protein HYPSUDRAFT_33585 [Hypholoma sublateritium FD-334 SS-4]|uniref:Peptidase C14 caspase domain-containing protein n=1 Tax=Hypholoma sublateritium (strain FD-334 SS-4) TaxID=945553 RepID=A0A0D2QBP9_HYPSF|nr:hypothetical protein HYPSUDRAFT_33585 [Hypholoma sublateritium FD-334 SS-4]